MVSILPKGGSVGNILTFMMFFLFKDMVIVAGNSAKCVMQTLNLVPNQPLKLLSEIDVHFDEVLAPGDLLYVPPGLSHYGVAEDDCLTFSFGFRMPNISGMIDRISDQFATDELLQNPVVDITRKNPPQIGEINTEELAYLRDLVLAQLKNSTVLDAALMSYMERA